MANASWLRWDVGGVTSKELLVVPALWLVWTSEEDRPAVVTAAWLHDVGYAPAPAVTGLHPLDGARYLRDEGWPELVVCLVAHHTGAEMEAEERRLSRELGEFERPPEALLDLVTTADLTTSPDGEDVDPEQRLAEILRRYPADDPVHRAVTSPHPPCSPQRSGSLAASGGNTCRYPMEGCPTRRVSP